MSFLDAKGAPGVVERARILFPLSQIGAITEGQRLDIRNASPLKGKYDQVIDRESAFEVLLADKQRAMEEQERQRQAIEAQKQQAELQRQQAAPAGKAKGGKAAKGIGSVVLTAAIGAAVSSLSRSAGNAAADALTGKKSTKKKTGKSAAEKAVSSATSGALRSLGRSILGNLLK